MSNKDTVNELERKLKLAQSPRELAVAFRSLAECYAEILQVASIRWAYVRGFKDPINMGQQALTSAFKFFAEMLHSSEFKKLIEEHTLRYLFEDRIWIELSHKKTTLNERSQDGVARSHIHP